MTMTARVTIGILVLLVISLGSYVSAQRGLQWGMQERLPKPILLSGSDVGFQVEARRGSAAIGRLMVRIDGEWVEADYSVGPSRATQ
jgi:hypothetical protein